VGVDLRQGDHLCADVHEVHGNTPIFETLEDLEYNESLEDIFKDNPEVGCAGLGVPKYSRIAFVCYLRENILKKCPQVQQVSKFYINLDRDTSRWEFWRDTDFTRFSATYWEDMDEYDPLFEKMVSYWNVPPEQHKAKCGAWISHVRMLEHIVDHKLNKVLVCEDDAEQVNPIPDDLPDDSLIYLGGFIMNRKISKKMTEKPTHETGLNILENRYRMIMLLAYYIPKWEMARDILNYLVKQYTEGRIRAIDIDLFNAVPEDKITYAYPAPFIERPVPSNIRTNKKKHSTENYEWR